MYIGELPKIPKKSSPGAWFLISTSDFKIIGREWWDWWGQSIMKKTKRIMPENAPHSCQYIKSSLHPRRLLNDYDDNDEKNEFNVMRLHTHCLQKMPHWIQIHRRLEDHRRPPLSWLLHQDSVVGYFAKSCVASTPSALLAKTHQVVRQWSAYMAVVLQPSDGSSKFRPQMLAIVDSSRSPPHQMVQHFASFCSRPTVTATFARQPQNTKHISQI